MIIIACLYIIVFILITLSNSYLRKAKLLLLLRVQAGADSVFSMNIKQRCEETGRSGLRVEHSLLKRRDSALAV